MLLLSEFCSECRLPTQRPTLFVLHFAVVEGTVHSFHTASVTVAREIMGEYISVAIHSLQPL